MTPCGMRIRALILNGDVLSHTRCHQSSWRGCWPGFIEPAPPPPPFVDALRGMKQAMHSPVGLYIGPRFYK